MNEKVIIITVDYTIPALAIILLHCNINFNSLIGE